MRTALRNTCYTVTSYYIKLQPSENAILEYLMLYCNSILTLKYIVQCYVATLYNHCPTNATIIVIIQFCIYLSIYLSICLYIYVCVCGLHKIKSEHLTHCTISYAVDHN